MKRAAIVSYILKYVVAVFTLSIVFCACNNQKTYRIGVSQCSDDAWRSKMNEEMKREVMFHDNVEIEIRSADDNSMKQIEDLNYFNENDFDIIITSPNEAATLTPVISKIHASGKPIIVFDRNINSNSYTAFQGADNYEIGRGAAHYARNLRNGQCLILEIRGLHNSTPAIDRSRGFRDVAASYPEMKILGHGYGNWNDTSAAKVADSLLSLYPEANLIYAHNDRMAIAASETAKAKGRDDIRIIGIDAAPAIGLKAVSDSIIDATFLYPTEGHRIIRTALSVLNGEPFDSILIFKGGSAVDLSNAEILLLQDKAMHEETDKVLALKAKVDEYWNKHSLQTSLLYASVVIVALLFILIFAMLRAFWIRKQHQAELAAQNKELANQRDQLIELNNRLEEATQSKLNFFTNVSHDLRTPLTLISTPLQQLTEADNLTVAQQNLLKLANKNTKILNRLINQILDFRKFENGYLSLSPAEVDLATLITEWSDAFVHMAKKRHISFNIEIDANSSFKTAVDPEKMERIYFNLLSNAFKYTPDNGVIKVNLSTNKDHITLRITDTGQGIATDDLERIFDRFFQVEKIHPNGSGIGLSLVKAFVELHRGEIRAESTLGKGSSFTITIPIVHVDNDHHRPMTTIFKETVDLEIGEIESGASLKDDSKERILIIDDNPDMRTLIKEIAGEQFNILQASDGTQGIKLAVKYTPDLIVCDVMMPGMDGFECCRLLKNELSTSHIPVLMLTACSMDEQKAEGYLSGADGYLSKPFSPEVFKARCRSLISNRRLIKNIFSSDPVAHEIRKTMPSDTENTVVANIDNEFYNKFCRLVEKLMSNPDLNVDDIASRLGLGRSQLYRKIKALTNYSPVELLRGMRLKKARRLLTTTERTISEIAYEVGFSSPAYFTKCYRDQYGETPSELQQRTSKPRQ